MILADSFLYFLLPALKNLKPKELEHQLNRLQLEVTEIKEHKLPKFKVAKILSYSLVEDLKYRYELVELNTENIYSLESNIYGLEIDRLIFFSQERNSFQIKDSELLSLPHLLGLKTVSYPVLILDTTEITESQFKELLALNFFLPKKTYELKEIYRYIDLSALWPLAQELSLITKLPCRETGELEAWFSDTFLGKYLLSLFSYLGAHNRNIKFWDQTDLDEENLRRKYLESKKNVLNIFFGKYLENIFDIVEKNKLRVIDTKFTNFSAKTIFKLSTLLPIFNDLKKNWEEKVIKRLRPFGFRFEKEENSSSDNYSIFWPIWYLEKSLPQINELLFRLLPFESKTMNISLKNQQETLPCWANLNENTKENEQKIIDILLSIEAFFTKKGFVQCLSPKFLKTEKNLGERELVLAYNPELTLRDHLHYSLFSILLDNLNNSGKLYPIFELFYSPWDSTWSLGCATISSFAKNSKNETIFYTLEELQKLLRELCSKINFPPLSFKRESYYLPQLKAALIFNIFVKKGEKEEIIGNILVHRAEQFELKKEEILSVELKLSDFLWKN